MFWLCLKFVAFKFDIRQDVLEKYIATIDEDIEYLFTTKDKKIMTSTAYSRLWEGIIKKLNAVSDEEIDTLTSKILRHTFCTYCAVVNLHPVKTQKLMGHSTTEMTMDVYTHLPLFNRYESSPIYKYYKEFLFSQNLVKKKKYTIKRKASI